jgi:hypothetical protein
MKFDRSQRRNRRRYYAFAQSARHRGRSLKRREAVIERAREKNTTAPVRRLP